MYGLYIHIPFCNQICSYCDFPKTVTFHKEKKELYIEALKKELLAYEKYFNEIETIYIGGGTPSSLDYCLLEELLSSLKNSVKSKVKEFTFEANPDSLDERKILLLKQYGVNRVSLGVESFNKDLLNTLRRTHNINHVKEVISLLKKNSITNINIDLMFAIPGQKEIDIINDLKEFFLLDIPHLSYYSLILEEKTILFNEVKKNKIELLDNQIEGNMYTKIIEIMKKNKFHHYEISNFSREGFESLHNQIYWLNNKYIGIGMGASGYVDNTRYTNSFSFDKYYQNEKEITVLTKKDIINEEFMLGLRLIDGISINRIDEKYGINSLKELPQINKLINKDLLTIKNGYLKLTEKGILFGNDVFVEFI